uniref:Uncharacterized protein n=1 Tax=Oryza glumipatula TaxID=40148 RepID=A0A0D9Z669_9ORYZ
MFSQLTRWGNFGDREEELTSQRLKADRSTVPSRMETVNGCLVARSYIPRCRAIHAAVVPASTPPPSIAAAASLLQLRYNSTSLGGSSVQLISSTPRSFFT